MSEGPELIGERRERAIVIHPVWWPIIIQTIGLLIAAFSYSSAMEHRLTTMENTQSQSKEILQELQHLNAAQDERLRMLETNQARMLALEEFVYRGNGSPLGRSGR